MPMGNALLSYKSLEGRGRPSNRNSATVTRVLSPAGPLPASDGARSIRNMPGPSTGGGNVRVGVPSVAHACRDCRSNAEMPGFS
jgi:hypothetical protein